MFKYFQYFKNNKILRYDKKVNLHYSKMCFKLVYAKRSVVSGVD